jgi:sec-independent protein translocase protein TatA
MSGRIGELILILFLVLILFGAGKLPKVMSELGRGLKAFRDGMNGETRGENEVQNTSDDSNKKTEDL